MNWIGRRTVFLVASVLLVGAVPGVLQVWNPADHSAGVWLYELETQSQASGSLHTVEILPEEWDNDYAAYKAENDGRISEWSADPESAPQLTGRPVKVTFVEPQPYDDLIRIVGPHADSFQGWTVVGVSETGDERIQEGTGRPEPSAVGHAKDPMCGIAVGPKGDPDPTACLDIHYTGFLEVEFELESGISDLVVLRDMPEVFLVDTTGLVVLEDLDRRGVRLGSLQGMTFPWVMYDTAVLWP